MRSDFTSSYNISLKSDKLLWNYGQKYCFSIWYLSAIADWVCWLYCRTRTLAGLLSLIVSVSSSEGGPEIWRRGVTSHHIPSIPVPSLSLPSFPLQVPSHCVLSLPSRCLPPLLSLLFPLFLSLSCSCLLISSQGGLRSTVSSPSGIHGGSRATKAILAYFGVPKKYLMARIRFLVVSLIRLGFRKAA